MTMNNEKDIHATLIDPADNEPQFAVLAADTVIAGQYVLVECLGQGGMGQAWLAEQIVERKHEHEVIPRFVLKVVPREVQNDSMAIDKVRAEYLKIINLNLKHPNICTLHPLAKDYSLGYVLVMEYIPGMNLRDYLYNTPEKKLQPEEVVRLLMPIADAWDYAHKRNLIHRDIKPANIMVTPDGTPQIIDFGLAAQIRNSISKVSKAQMSTSGTPAYMAPEQWMGELQDARTDQYALSTVAYELLSGCLPFASDNDRVLGFQVTAKPVPLIKELPNEINAVLAKALAKKREDRFADCREFVRSLENALREIDVRSKNNYQSPFKDIFEAAEKGTIEDVRYFVERKGVDVNAKDERDRTPLHYAATGNLNVEVLQYLIYKGADVNTKDDGDWTPLHWAARGNSNVEVLQYLVSHGADVNAKDNQGDTPLHKAASNNFNIAVLNYLISQGVDVNAKNNHGDTPLHEVATYSTNIEELKYFVSHGADVNAKNNQGDTPLHSLAICGYDMQDFCIESVTYLVSQGADINAKDNSGATLLHWVALFSNVEVLEYLVSHGADVNAKDNSGWTPWDFADGTDYEIETKRILQEAMGTQK